MLIAMRFVTLVVRDVNRHHVGKVIEVQEVEVC